MDCAIVREVALRRLTFRLPSTQNHFTMATTSRALKHRLSYVLD